MNDSFELKTAGLGSKLICDSLASWCGGIHTDDGIGFCMVDSKGQSGGGFVISLKSLKEVVERAERYRATHANLGKEHDLAGLKQP